MAAVKDEVPAELYLNVPGIRYMTELVLSPGMPSDMVRKNALKFASELASWTDGAVEDMQPAKESERFIYCGVRYSFPEINEYTLKTYIALWYAPECDLSRHVSDIITAFRDILPYCLPEKYGVSSPTEFEYEKSGGFDAFASFIESVGLSAVWYPKLPVINVTLLDSETDPQDAEGRVSHICIELPDSVYGYPEWSEACRRLLKRLALAGFDPESGKGGAFFGQIIRRAMKTASWWWQGIPEETGEAFVIGKPYLTEIGETKDGEMLSPCHIYCEFPGGPVFNPSLVSRSRKRLFSSGRGYLSPSDFKRAGTIPFACFSRRIENE